MSTNLHNDWERIIEQCKLRIDKNSTAGIKSVIQSMKLSADPTDEDLQSIAATITKDYRYILELRNDEWYISNNPSCALIESTLGTNRNVKITSIVSAIFAGVSTFFIIAATLKQCSDNPAKQEQQMLKESQRQSKALEKLNSSLQGGKIFH